MSVCRVFSCVVAMTSAFSWQNSVSLCPASFCTSRPNLPVTPGISWLPTFAFQTPVMKRTSFWMLVLEGLVSFHKTVQLQLLQHYWLGHRLGLLWYWMVCLGNKQRSFCLFWDCAEELKNSRMISVHFQERPSTLLRAMDNEKSQFLEFASALL